MLLGRDDHPKDDESSHCEGSNAQRDLRKPRRGTGRSQEAASHPSHLTHLAHPLYPSGRIQNRVLDRSGNDRAGWGPSWHRPGRSS
jgi:hypothetical protein